jgi:hypothetical protein
MMFPAIKSTAWAMMISLFWGWLSFHFLTSPVDAEFLTYPVVQQRLMIVGFVLFGCSVWVVIAAAWVKAWECWQAHFARSAAEEF